MHNVTRTPPLKTAIRTAFINPSSTGASEIVAAVPNGAIRVISLAVISTIANAVNLASAATDITAVFPLGANGGIVLPFNEHGWCQTAIGEALNIEMSVATATGVHVQYVVVLGSVG